MDASNMKVRCVAIAENAAQEHGLGGEIYIARKIADTIAALPVEADHRNEQILALAAAKRDLEAQVAALREALCLAREDIVNTMETYGDDEVDTDKTIVAIDLALAATEPKGGIAKRNAPK